jgi:chemotaxis response regulator CheB
MTDDPWAGAQEVCNKFARIDGRLAEHLNRLSVRQVSEAKLAQALESGRVYGLRQYKCQMLLKRGLNRECRRPLVEHAW